MRRGLDGDWSACRAGPRAQLLLRRDAAAQPWLRVPRVASPVTICVVHAIAAAAVPPDLVITIIAQTHTHTGADDAVVLAHPYRLDRRTVSRRQLVEHVSHRTRHTNVVRYSVFERLSRPRVDR